MDEPEIIVSTNPTLKYPEALDVNALMATTDETIKGLNDPSPRRGRPPGSRNKPKTFGSSQLSTLQVPRSNRRPPQPPKDEQTEEDKAREAAIKRQLIQERTAQYRAFILTDINEYIMSAFVAMGVPTAVIYNPGQAPTEEVASERYTPIGNQLAIGPQQSKYLARFAAEMAATDVGNKTTGLVTEGPVALVISGAFAAFGVFQWASNVMKVRKAVEPLIAAYKAAQAQGAKKDVPETETVVRDGGSDVR